MQVELITVEGDVPFMLQQIFQVRSVKCLTIFFSGFEPHFCTSCEILGKWLSLLMIQGSYLKPDITVLTSCLPHMSRYKETWWCTLPHPLQMQGCSIWGEMQSENLW